MHLNVTIDGRLVAHADGAGPAVDRHGGPGTWRELLDRHGSLGSLAAPAGRCAHAVSIRFG